MPRDHLADRTRRSRRATPACAPDRARRRSGARECFRATGGAGPPCPAAAATSCAGDAPPRTPAAGRADSAASRRAASLGAERVDELDLLGARSLGCGRSRHGARDRLFLRARGESWLDRPHRAVRRRRSGRRRHRGRLHDAARGDGALRSPLRAGRARLRGSDRHRGNVPGARLALGAGGGDRPARRARLGEGRLQLVGLAYRSLAAGHVVVVEEPHLSFFDASPRACSRALRFWDRTGISSAAPTTARCSRGSHSCTEPCSPSVCGKPACATSERCSRCSGSCSSSNWWRSRHPAGDRRAV